MDADSVTGRRRGPPGPAQRQGRDGLTSCDRSIHADGNSIPGRGGFDRGGRPARLRPMLSGVVPEPLERRFGPAGPRPSIDRRRAGRVRKTLHHHVASAPCFSEPWTSDPLLGLACALRNCGPAEKPARQPSKPQRKHVRCGAPACAAGLDRGQGAQFCPPDCRGNTGPLRVTDASDILNARITEQVAAMPGVSP